MKNSVKNAKFVSEGKRSQILRRQYEAELNRISAEGTHHAKGTAAEEARRRMIGNRDSGLSDDSERRLTWR